MKASERISEIYGALEKGVNDRLKAKGQPHLDQASPQAMFLLLRAIVDYLDEQVQ